MHKYIIALLLLLMVCQIATAQTTILEKRESLVRNVVINQLRQDQFVRITIPINLPADHNLSDDEVNLIFAESSALEYKFKITRDGKYLFTDGRELIMLRHRSSGLDNFKPISPITFYYLAIKEGLIDYESVSLRKFLAMRLSDQIALIENLSARGK